MFKVDLLKQVRISSNDLRNEDPVNQFVFREMVSVKKILGYVNQSIQSIVKVLQGTEMLTPKIESEATALLKAEVPQSWEKQWEGPETPTAWLRVLCKKGVAMVGWVQRAQQNQLLSQPVSLSDLLHPETFLNAFRQKSARTLSIAIDELKLVSSFDQSRMNTKVAMQVEGLWLQGCAFQGSRLTDIQGQANEIASLPTCHLAWISMNEADPYPSGVVDTPLYHNMDREKLLCTLKIFNQGEAQQRIISGVAMFLNGSE